MKQQILDVLKSCKGRAGYYGLTIHDLTIHVIPGRDWTQQGVTNKQEYQVLMHCLELESENKIYIARSSQQSDRGSIQLITYRETGE